MVNDAGNWPWSSYLAMTDQAAKLDCLQTDWLLAQFALERNQAIIGYQKFICSGVGLPPLWEELKKIQYSLEIKPLWKKCKVELKP